MTYQRMATDAIAASRERTLNDLVAAGERMAEALDAFERGDLMAITKEGDPVILFKPDASPAGFGEPQVREWRRLLEDARRMGVVP